VLQLAVVAACLPQQLLLIHWQQRIHWHTHLKQQQAALAALWHGRANEQGCQATRTGVQHHCYADVMQC
jgi:hypothetical protein